MADYKVGGAIQSMAGSYEKLTVTNAVKTLTSTKYNVRPNPTNFGEGGGRFQTTTLAEEAFITVETQPIRYTVDGTTPSTTDGHLAAAGDTIYLEGFDNIARFQCIRSTGSDSTIHVTYFRR